MADRRPIPGAVATLGVSERVAFLRRTYAHLGIALLAFAAVTAGMMRFMPETSLKFSAWALKGSFNWLLVLGLFMVVGWIAERMARSDTSRGVQYLGLGLAVTAQGVLLQPLLWVAIVRFGAGGANDIILNAALITMTIFVGLTATVFVTKKDFSFLRGILTVLTFGALGIILASMLFGFALGAVFCGAMIALMAGYILFQTSAVMKDFPPTHHVAAALMLFSTVATLFWYVLQLLMSLRGD
ncbi:MAG: Bax inhibitor-1 family protein [Kofleriaceae bacterium]|nr:Bax inhibitor-1 family protein [Kofleriaceae bacterium]MCL4227452.1 Bax inhibitor-1 family protein [Myxococcales bacterium]